MSSLDTSFEKIHKMLRIQFGGIQKSFERSLNIPRHKQRTDYIFSNVICQISLEALELIDEQLQYADTASPFIAGYCDCTIKVTHGLPCMHDLANYRSLCIPIPLRDIDSHWTRLCMHADRSNAAEPRSDRTSEVFELLQGMDPSTRDNMINRIIDMTDPSHSTVRSPAYNTEHRGRPAGRNEQSRRRIPSILESYSSGSRGHLTQLQIHQSLHRLQNREFVKINLQLHPSSIPSFRNYLRLIRISLVTLLTSKLMVIVDSGR